MCPVRASRKIHIRASGLSAGPGRALCNLGAFRVFCQNAALRDSGETPLGREEERSLSGLSLLRFFGTDVVRTAPDPGWAPSTAKRCEALSCSRHWFGAQAHQCALPGGGSGAVRPYGPDNRGSEVGALAGFVTQSRRSGGHVCEWDEAGCESRVASTPLHNPPRRFQSSGKSSTSSILRRYFTPLVPPVPRLKPMMRSTVVTWLKRQRRK